MKKLLSITTILGSLLIFVPQAQADMAVAKVNGMVCDFCAQSITKVFLKEDPVSAVDVNLDTQSVSIELKDGQNLSEDKIKELIEYSGYDLVGITYEDGVLSSKENSPSNE